MKVRKDPQHGLNINVCLLLIELFRFPFWITLFVGYGLTTAWIFFIQIYPSIFFRWNTVVYVVSHLLAGFGLCFYSINFNLASVLGTWLYWRVFKYCKTQFWKVVVICMATRSGHVCSRFEGRSRSWHQSRGLENHRRTRETHDRGSNRRHWIRLLESDCILRSQLVFHLI